MYPLVSVIIPIYNSADFLNEAVQSVINQSYHELQIILVNDGSTDLSATLMEEWKARDYRIITIHKENQGQASARLEGLNASTGEYIFYFDSDDILLPTAIEQLVQRAGETGADLVVAPFLFCHTEVSYLSNTQPFDTLTGIDYFRHIVHMRAYWAVWSFLHRRNLYTKHNIVSSTSIRLGEDAILTTQLALYSNKVAFSKHPILQYYIRSTSMSNQPRANHKVISDLRSYPQWIYRFIESLNLQKVLQKEIVILKIRTTFDCIHRQCLRYADKDMKNSIELLKHFPEVIHLFSKREQKLIRYYRVSKWLGAWKLHKYQKQGRL